MFSVKQLKYLKQRKLTVWGQATLLAVVAVGQKEEWLLNGWVAFAPFEFPIGDCILIN